MSILKTVLNAFSLRAVKWGSAPPRDPVVASWFGWNETASGANVTPDSALQVSAVYACVRVLAETLASVPLVVYKRLPNGGKDRDFAHYLYRILHDQPNEWQTSFEFREMMMGHLCLRGNAYAQIISGPKQGVSALVPLHPDRVRPFIAPNKKIAYEYQPLDGQKQVFLREEIFHLRGLSQDGIIGLNPIQLQREAVGLAMVTEEHGARLFSNGTELGGVLKHPGKMGKDAFERLEKSWKQRYAGIKNTGSTAILEEGMTFEKMGMTSEDAQFLETRKYQVSEIARIFRVPPHMIGDLEKATFSNIEQQSLEFVQFTMMPWFTRWEQAIQRDLIVNKELNFTEFMVQGLLRGDLKSRYEAYATGRQWGWLSANDIRGMENLNPIEDGDVYLSPMNMTPANQLGQQEQNQDANRA